MALRGTAFMAIWHDIHDHGETEYNQWHTVQHMPERVGVPGFLAGRRYVDWSLDKYRYFTLYEGDRLEVFSSEAYRNRLNNPTDWTNRVQPYFINFVRSACETVLSESRGIGGALATLRLDAADGGLQAFEQHAKQIAGTALGLHGITGVHFGWASPSTTRIETRETQLRTLTGEDVFDGAVMVEGIGRREVTAVVGEIQSRLNAVAALHVTNAEVYDLAFHLTAEEV